MSARNRVLLCISVSLLAVPWCRANQVSFADEPAPPLASVNVHLLEGAITLDQEVYVPGEVATVTISVRNPTDRPLEVVSPFWPDSGSCFDLWGQGPRAASLGADFVPMSPEPCSRLIPRSETPIVIQPGEALARTVRTNSAYGQSQNRQMLYRGALPDTPGEYRLSYSYLRNAYAQFRTVDTTIEQYASLSLGEIVDMPEEGEASADPRTLHAVAAVLGDKRLILHSIGSRKSFTKEDLDRLGIAELAPLKRVAELDGPVTGLKLVQQTDGALLVQWCDSANNWHEAVVTEAYENWPGAVAAPAFSPIAGLYSAPQTVAISTATPDATIRYTTDGSLPTATTGAIYGSPVSISSTTTLKARAFATDKVDSPAAVGTYTIAPPPGPVDVSGSVEFETTGFVYSRVTKTYNGTLRITNTSATAIPAPMHIVLTDLIPGVSVANANGTYQGAPYLTLPEGASLPPGTIGQVGVRFDNPSNVRINFVPVTYSGAF